MSSPNLNNLIIIGCILVYIAGMLFGLKKEGDSMLCQVTNIHSFHKATKIAPYRVPLELRSLFLKVVFCTCVLQLLSLVKFKTKQSIKKNKAN